jgi:hypothetical protein
MLLRKDIASTSELITQSRRQAIILRLGGFSFLRENEVALVADPSRRRKRRRTLLISFENGRNSVSKFPKLNFARDLRDQLPTVVRLIGSHGQIKTITEIDAPAVFIHGVIDLMFAA